MCLVNVTSFNPDGCGSWRTSKITSLVGCKSASTASKCVACDTSRLLTFNIRSPIRRFVRDAEPLGRIYSKSNLNKIQLL